MSEKQYRLLNVGEFVNQCDEFYQGNEWHQAGVVNWQITKGNSPFRRLIEPSPDLTAANAEIERLRFNLDYEKGLGDTLKQQCRHLESEFATLRAEKQPKAPACDGWIAWQPPPQDGIEVEVRLRDGEHDQDLPEEFDWSECGEGTITHYRIVPPPAPAFVVDKPGVYRRRDGETALISERIRIAGDTYDIKTHPWKDKDRGYTYRSDGGYCMDRRDKDSIDLIEFIASPPPDSAGPLLQVKPGDPLPEKFWFYYLKDNEGWDFSEDKEAAHKDFIYAAYIEPAKPEPTVPDSQTIIASPQRDGWVSYVGAGEVGTC